MFEPTLPADSTRLYRLRAPQGDFDRPEGAEELVGYLAADGTLYRLRLGEGRAVGRADADLHIFRTGSHGERELGHALPTGAIHSAGLLEGGPLGWLDPDGVVFQGGLIFGEEEVGRVEGPQALAAAAALLLLFLPDERELDRRALR